MMTPARLLALVAVAALVPGCLFGDGVGAGVSNRPGAFSYGGDVTAKSGVEEHEWRNDKRRAQIEWSGEVQKGSVQMRILDANGVDVFTTNYGIDHAERTDGTREGAPGEWKIILTFSDMTGRMGIEVASAT